MNLEKIKERYLKDDAPTRLGGLAANLARIGSFSQNPGNHKAVNNLIEESKWFIEWSKDSLPLDKLKTLADIQVELACTQLWLKTHQTELTTLSLRAKEWSQTALHLSGL